MSACADGVHLVVVANRRGGKREELLRQFVLEILCGGWSSTHHLRRPQAEAAGSFGSGLSARQGP